MSSTATPANRSNPPAPRENTASSLLNLDGDRPQRTFNNDWNANGSAPPRSRTSTHEIQRLIARTDERYSRIRNQRAEVQKRMEAQRAGEEYMMHMPRRWREGDVFTPHDLSGNEMRKWRKRQDRKEDVLDVVGVNPLDNYRVGFPPSLYLPLAYPVGGGQRGGERIAKRKLTDSGRRTTPSSPTSPRPWATSSTPARRACAPSTSARSPRPSAVLWAWASTPVSTATPSSSS